jgi:hypothetical protein
MSFLSHGATSTTTTTTRIVSTGGTAKKALCMGINNYPDPENRLAGCVNDANDWAAYLRDVQGFSIQMLIDSQATSYKFKEIAGNYFTSSKAGEKYVITYSGHGSNVPDEDGDEEDGRDECICLYDRFFIDDEIRKLFKLLNPEASLTLISDSCHSGTVTRAFLSAIGDAEERLRPRYMPPKDDNEAFEIKPSGVRSGARVFYPESGMNHILISGCLSTEYSYDARINGRNNGAMTAFALQVLKNNSNLTYAQFYTELKKLLPSQRYPQTPQLEGSDTNKNKIVFT